MNGETTCYIMPASGERPVEADKAYVDFHYGHGKIVNEKLSRGGLDVAPGVRLAVCWTLSGRKRATAPRTSRTPASTAT